MNNPKDVLFNLNMFPLTRLSPLKAKASSDFENSICRPRQIPRVGNPSLINFLRNFIKSSFFKFVIASSKFPTPGRINNSEFSNIFLFFVIISEKYVSEILLSDVKNEGMNEAFDAKILKIKEFYNIPFILFGGISSKKQIDFLIRKKNVSALAISNFLSYKEHAYQLFKKSSKNYFRPSYFHL